MSTTISHLEPTSIWSHFDQLRQIPRPSKNEAAVRDHIKAWAVKRGFESVEDAAGNLCVRVPGSPGHENARIVIMQGHLDMVPEKNKTSNHDFDKDPIEVIIDGDWVVAPDTTLGADNGIGVAAAMASADDPACVHGPLELLFTIDEETGLTGATELDGSILKGRTLLNLDSEEDGTLFVGCAGGTTTEIKRDMPRAAAPAGWAALRIDVVGLRGGHSGLNIHENRGNSIKILARLLNRWMEKTDLRIDSFDGGNKHNAIPREAVAVVVVPAAFADGAVEFAAAEYKKILTEYESIDPGLAIHVTRLDVVPVAPGTEPAARALVTLLIGLPHGVLAMSRDIQGLTETSTNVAIIRTEGEAAYITTSSRSSVAIALRGALDQANAVIRMAGARFEEVGAYPAWQPNMKSPLLNTCKQVFTKLYGGTPKVTAIHAGLECGIIADKVDGDVDIISYGPQLEGVHAPGEKVCISSVARFWEFHKQVLAQLA